MSTHISVGAKASLKNAPKAVAARRGEATAGTMNIFADLGLPNPDMRLAKVHLSVIVNNAIDADGLTISQAAKKLGITPARVSSLQNYRLKNFSLFSLMKCVTALGYDVNIKLRPNEDQNRSGHILVEAA